jgi:uncharacterized membrane protein (UPF0127 family)
LHEGAVAPAGVQRPPSHRLLGRKSLKPDGGVWIFPSNAIHTIGMLFSFDVVMIDKDFRVVSVKEMVKPFRIILPKRRAESVIELPAHTIFRSRTEVGDQLLIDRYEAKKVTRPQSPTRQEEVTAITVPLTDRSGSRDRESTARTAV